jgi:hypothetical protein
MAMLMAMGLLGNDSSAQAQAQAEPALFNPEYFTPGQKQQSPDIMKLLQSLQRRTA